MYYDRNSQGNAGCKVTAADILARINARKQGEASGTLPVLTASDVSPDLGKRYFAPQMPADGDEVREQLETGATALSHKRAGATALINKDIESNIKAVAPTALSSTAISGVDDNSSMDKELAAVACDPNERDVDVSLRSSISIENEIKDDCDAGDEDRSGQADTAPAGDEALSGDADAENGENQEPEYDLLQPLFDPNFFKVRIDFFDNGAVKNRTQYTAKLDMQIRPEDQPADHMQMFVNFYSRSRDYRAFVKKHNLDDDWYRFLYEAFESVCARKLDFEIKPIIGVMKEKRRDPVTKQVNYVPNMHTGAVLWKEQGKDPMIFAFFSAWQIEKPLDAEFSRKVSSAPKARLNYIDPQRAHLDVPKATRGIQRLTASRFSAE